MAGFVVDEMGNCWAEDDTERKTPMMPHPELEGDRAKCPECGAYVWREKTSDRNFGTFTWKCGNCGWEDDTWHH